MKTQNELNALPSEPMTLLVEDIHQWATISYLEDWLKKNLTDHEETPLKIRFREAVRKTLEVFNAEMEIISCEYELTEPEIRELKARMEAMKMEIKNFNR